MNPGSSLSTVSAVAGLLLSACASSAPPRAEVQDTGVGTAALCQVRVRNASDYVLDTSYSSGVRGSLGDLQPNQSVEFAVPCDQGRVLVTGMAGGRVSLDRGRPWTREAAVLVPGEVAEVVLRGTGGEA